MKKTAAILLGGLGAGYIIALIRELIKGHGMIVVEASKMDHWTFLILLSWCLASIYAAYHLYQAKDD